MTGQQTTVWIVGSSLVKNAFVEARKRPGGVNLSLQRLGVNIWWQGRSGLNIRKLQDHIKVMLRYEDPPNKLIIHIGGNDIGNVRVGYVQYQLKELCVWLSQLMPETAFIWSNILPRLQWRYSNNNGKK